MKNQTFLELINTEEIDCELIIANCEMPATFVWEGIKITDEGIKRFQPVMDATYTKLPNGNVEVHCDDYTMGKDFVMSAAGFVSASLFDLWFLYTDE